MNIKEYKLELGIRQKAFTSLLLKDEAAIFLHDLAKFCRANTSTFHEDPRIHAVLEGRREVWLRIRDHLDLTSEEFLEKYARTSKQKGNENE